MEKILIWFHHKQQGRVLGVVTLKTRMMIELKGKARREVKLDSLIPMDLKLIDDWHNTWISKKEFKHWKKQDWPEKILGERIEGKIHKAGVETAQGIKSFSGNILAVEPVILDATGTKKTLPLILYGVVKKKLKMDIFDSLNLSSEIVKNLEKMLKSDSWAPISIWHPEKVHNIESRNITNLLEYTAQISRLIFYHDSKSIVMNSYTATHLYK
ncbi:MAG: hypothetical protein BAJATHORv1_40343 [Candidatus Thorarchaeota archaeon]|nr:MAG: hypothetical protein BAJATHORv1_40343 [Candidatus Thorarchaeota archaeon]